MANRVSTTQLFHRSRTELREAQDRLGETARKASTFKEIDVPSKDATGWVRAKGIKDELSVNNNIAKNAEMANHFLAATEDILASVQEYVGQAHKGGLAAAGDVTADSPAAREAILAEVKGLYRSTIQVLNSRYSNRTLMGGQKTLGPAFDAQGKYLGDNGQILVEVQQGIKVPINIDTRKAVFGEGLERGTNILGAFQRLIHGLEENDKDVIRGTLEELNRSTDQISLIRSEIAASMSQIERSVGLHESDKVHKLDVAAQIEEADAVKVFSDLARDQTTLNAAMSTAEKLLSDLPRGLPFK